MREAGLYQEYYEIRHDGGLSLLKAELMVLFQDIVHMVENQYGGESKSCDQRAIQGQDLREIIYGFPIDKIGCHQGKACIKLHQKETKQLFRTGANIL